MRMVLQNTAQVFSYYRQLLRLTARLPADKAAAARSEARATIRERSGETDEARAQQHLKELAARVSFLRMTTPRPAGEPLDAGRFIYRSGKWESGEGESKGSRCVQAARCVAWVGGVGANVGCVWMPLLHEI
jgi:hypothetical protein